jgi:4-hydroxybenzoate polyprenyltransferase
LTTLLTRPATAPAHPLPVRRGPAAAALAGMRPRQWTKNLLLFAGLLFARRLTEAESWVSATAIFVAYCSLSSAAYLMNDVRDRKLDRLHPTKRLRPVASGELPPARALAVAGWLAALGLGIAAAVGLSSVVFLAGFAALQIAYSFRLKKLVVADLLAISALFVVRAAAGAAAVDVRISPWLLACTALLALFLGLGKRRAELALVGGAGAASRPVLARYSLPALKLLVRLTAALTVIAYTLYALTARDSGAMVVTIPFVLFGLLRYLYLMGRRDLGEEPEQVLLTDLATLACVGCWAVSAAIALAAS